VYRALHTAVLYGILSAGDRLPSTRQAAADYGVSRGLMEEVFGQLTDEGFFERAVGRGTFVAREVARLRKTGGRKTPQTRSPREPSSRGSAFAASAACREPEVPVAFNAGIADTSQFPWKVWCRLQAQAARELGLESLGFADPRGLANLRASIARHLGQFRGIRCTPQQVVIFSSAQQALNALVVLLLDRGEAAWIEDPCYLGARAALELADTRLVPVRADEDGIVVKEGIRCAPRASMAYVTPPHQYPTGVALSLERRIELLAWAARSNAWIVEDDYDGELRYTGQPLASLYALDSQARVLYLGTLNKAMFVSLRLAYVVVPEELVEPLANLRTHMDGFTPALTQMTMSLFMDEGCFSSHLRNMRGVYAAKWKMLVDGLAPLAGQGWTWPSNPAGMHLLVRHPRGEYARAVAKASELDLALLSRYQTSRARGDGLFLRFGALDARSLQSGVEKLVEVAKGKDRAALPPRNARYPESRLDRLSR
jgi:GntR family transcriptional regulator/MocR family aminotransferase